MTEFRESVNQHYNLDLKNYDDLYDWSVTHIADFWAAMWEYGEIIHSRSYDSVVDDDTKMPGAKWFAGSRLNFAENLLRYHDDKVALHFRGEDQVRRQVTYRELYDQVRRLAHALREMGVIAGDRVAGFMPNIPESIIAMLATASIGAVWSSSSPDFGIQGVLDRFGQIKPKVLFAADGYHYAGRRHSSMAKLEGIVREIDSIEQVVVVTYTERPELSHIPNGIHWDEFVPESAPPLQFEQLPFDHPLYIMYSSGTTGLPKSIVHSTGGTLIQHLKEHKLHCDLRRDDTMFYFTTCGWMMWNWLVSGLAVGATLVLYDGNPMYPHADSMWRMAEELRITIFGTSAKFISAQEVAGVNPRQTYDLKRLRVILSTGSTLMEESYDYVYRDVKADVLLGSISGGTDLISCFALANPTLPVHRGRLQCRGLGMKVEAYGPDGQPVTEEQGELVCTAPFPSMPIYFWNDDDGSKYHSAYFDHYPGIWRHGDFVSLFDDGSLQIYGRSDATLNPGGVRIGTAEIYRVVEVIPGISDSLVVGIPDDGDTMVVLFVKLKSGSLDQKMAEEIRRTLRTQCSPRHVPHTILETPDVPYTISGKKVELAVKQVLMGEKVLNADALANPQSLDFYRSVEL